MLEIHFEAFEFPKRMNLHILQELLTPQAYMDLLLKYLDKPREERRIVLPSRKCLIKVLAYHLGQMVRDGIMDWDTVMASLKGNLKLKDMNLSREKLKRLYRNREMEIIRETRETK